MVGRGERCGRVTMNFVRAIAFGFVLTGLGNASVTEWVETKIGEDWYYRMCRDSYKTIWFDKLSQTFVKIPYAHTPNIPIGFQIQTEYTRGFQSRTEYTLQGFPFKPRKFWEKPIEKQLVYLKEAIWECDLLNAVNKGRNDPSKQICYSVAPRGEPYPDGLEKKFERKVWQILRKEYDITLYDFVKSLRSMLIPEDRLWEAPLIVYFSDKLAPQCDFYYSGKSKWSRVLTKIKKRPSVFETLNGASGMDTVVYETKE